MIYFLRMKKNILLILLSAALLTGCEFDITLQRLFGGKDKEQETQQKEENSQEKPEENQQSGDNEDQQPSGDQGGNGGGGNQQGGEEQGIVKTVNFSGSVFSVVGTSGGVSIDTSLSSGANGAQHLKECIESQLNDSSLFTGMTALKLNTAPYDSKAILCIGTGNPAKDDFNPGTFTWNSNKKIYKVELSAQCYIKDQGATDRAAHILLDSQDNSLEVAEAETLEFKTFSKEYEAGTKSFTLTSQGGRVFLKSLTITWGD